MPVWLSPARLAERVALLRRLSEQAGRPRPAVSVMVFCAVSSSIPRAERAADQYLRAQYKVPYERAREWTPIGDVDHVAGALAELMDAGATGFILVPLSDDPLGQVELLAGVRERLPALGVPEVTGAAR
jgi:alkanesulfonate monooxygenase SsuD/methylene tetrahydromethanopterin reductase-like flavin-dependent oxidoreductase (luciferase family)